MENLCSRAVLAIASLVLVAGCVVRVNADGGRQYDVSKVFGSIEVGEGRSVGDVESVNGSIRLEDDSTAGEVETVNGSIKIYDHVSARSLETTNGRIRGGRNLQVEDGITTVNGSIDLEKGTVVGRDVRNVNGSIEISGTEIKGNVSTVNGDVIISRGSVVHGDVVFREPGRSWWHDDHDEPTLDVDDDCRIEGDIVLYQRVRLRIADGASIGDIVERY